MNVMHLVASLLLYAYNFKGNAHLRTEIFVRMQRKMSPLLLLQNDMPEKSRKEDINEIIN